METSPVISRFGEGRNMLDIGLTFTYHTQAFGTGLTAVAGIILRGNEVRSIFS